MRNIIVHELQNHQIATPDELVRPIIVVHKTKTNLFYYTCIIQISTVAEVSIYHFSGQIYKAHANFLGLIDPSC